MSFWGQLNFNDAVTPIMEELTLLHDHAMVVLLGIIVFVGVITVQLMTNSFTSRYLLEGQQLETIWTVIPVVILLSLALPSLRLLYLLDEVMDPAVILKSVGHQWYWSYEMSNPSMEFDSYMVNVSDLEGGEPRLLEVDNRVVFPCDVESQVLVTSADVIHSWTIPSLGVKADAIPGRLNSMSLHLFKPGVFYGQCSEICGANHSFMPIVVEAVSISLISMTWYGCLPNSKSLLSLKKMD